MDAIDRRSALRTLVCGAVAAGFGTSLLPDAADAMPLAMQKDPGKDAGDFSQQAQAEVTGRPPGGRPPARPPSHRPPSHRPPPHHRRRRRRRWECWWHRGRRHCDWRWSWW